MKRTYLFFALPFLFGILGSVMNELVVALNHGYMPVFMPGHFCLGNDILDHNHICMSATTHLNWLADWVVSNSGVSSPGDFLEDLGSAIKLPSFVLAILNFFRKERNV